MNKKINSSFKHISKLPLLAMGGLFLLADSVSASVPIVFKVGGSQYYQGNNCIVKAAFKYRNIDLEPLATSPIEAGSQQHHIDIATASEQENNVLEHISIYVLRVGKNKQVDAIANNTKIKVKANPRELKAVKVWFEEGPTGQRSVLRAETSYTTSKQSISREK